MSMDRRRHRMFATKHTEYHLRGDEYFRVSQRGENLDRAAEQFTLLQQFNGLRAQLFECALAQLF